MPKARNNQKMKTNKGSILIGVLIMFLMIASISIALINRSRHGATLATDSKKGYVAYQESDSGAEELLNEVKKRDRIDSGPIPENMLASDICDATLDYNCYGQDGTGNPIALSGTTAKIAEIFYIKKKATNQLLSRSVLVPMLDRVANPVTDLEVQSISPNSCDVGLIGEYDTAINADQKVSSLEIRKSQSSSLSNGSWQKLVWNETEIACGGSPCPAPLSKRIFNNEFNYNTTYYFSIKAKNINPLTLDSLYYSKNPLPSLAVPGKNCSGGQRVDCLAAPVLGSSVATTPYNCCGNGDSRLYCIECDAGWRVEGSCCRQTCPAPTPCPSGPCGGGDYTACIENSCSYYTPETCTPPIGYSSCDDDGCYC